jgi:succinate dehydrogenase / fumarate reductase, flavoprotein subunit
MSECCGVIRDERGLREGLARLDDICERTRELEVRPDIAGYADLAHAFDLHASTLAARATLECALERRETRGAHSRSDFPGQDDELQVNLLWAGEGSVTSRPVSACSSRLAALAAAPPFEGAKQLLE